MSQRNEQYGSSVVLLTLFLGITSVANAESAKSILEAVGVEGGLVVHLGCGDGELTAALRVNDRYLIHGLDDDVDLVNQARQRIRSADAYGPVSVDLLKGGRLPYIDGLANLVVSEDLGDVTIAEVMRVLCPHGVAYIKQGEQWIKRVKPRPVEMDEWTHYLHDADGNAVAHDDLVGPPRHLQWVGSPRWARHHDRMASMSALVSSGGRVFYIFDEGSTASIQLPSKPMLIARDAFNGVVLWKRPISDWHTRLWPYKSGPAQLPRRLVAVGDRVYATLGLSAPLTSFDAATGETIRTFEGSQATEEVIASEGQLFLLVNESALQATHLAEIYQPAFRCMHEERDRVADVFAWDEQARFVVAVQADTGEELWRQRTRVVPLTLTADAGNVYFHDGESIVCLDRADGKQRWRSSPVSRRPTIPSNFGPTLVVHQDVILFSGGDRSMSALSAATGETLWTAQHPRSGHHSPEDLLVAGGLVWSGAIAVTKDSGIFAGRDLHTGEIKQQFPPDVETYWFHHRCYRSKATDRFLLPSRTGIEFVDIEAEHWDINHWVRGGCIYGIMPCNGLVYAPQHSCACYMDAKLNGFCALAPARNPRGSIVEDSANDRLQRGPAFGRVSRKPQASTLKPLSDWPTYRYNSSRSGCTPLAVPAKLQGAWRTQLGGRLSSPVIAEQRVYVASIDQHTVHALDSETGDRAWSYTVGGRVNSPPTIYRGMVLFGSADGCVYCLQAEDGVLVWRFHAAPNEQRVVAFEQLESVWPIHGSVLVRDGVAYCIAGRSMFLDGGLRFYKLDAETGRELSRRVLDEKDPELGGNLQERLTVLNMPTALPDILSCDDQFLYMRTQRFDFGGERQHVAPGGVEEQDGEGSHLFSNGGFLDDSWFHRAYWQYGKSIASGANGWYLAGRRVPAGRPLVVDENSVYGFGRRPEYFRWTTPAEFHLFCSDKQATTVARETGEPLEPPRQEKCEIPATRLAYRWSTAVPLHVRAMVMAGNIIFIAGPPDVIDDEEAYRRWTDPAMQQQLVEQDRALLGERGASLWAVSATDGEKLASLALPHPPVWDGMAAAGGRLYLATADGSVSCFAGE